MNTTIGIVAFAFKMMAVLSSKDVFPGLYKPRPVPLARRVRSARDLLRRKAKAVVEVLAGVRFIRQEYDLEMGARWCNKEPVEHFLVFAVGTFGRHLLRQLHCAVTQHSFQVENMVSPETASEDFHCKRCGYGFDVTYY